MRPVIMLVSLALITACSDQDHPTSPIQPRSGLEPRALNATDNSIASEIKVAQAKPTDQVGFTKTTVIESNPIWIIPGSDETYYVNCPAGSMVTGGGYTLNIPSLFVGSPPFVYNSRPVATGGKSDNWTISMKNEQPGSSQFTAVFYAVCVS